MYVQIFFIITVYFLKVSTNVRILWRARVLGKDRERKRPGVFLRHNFRRVLVVHGNKRQPLKDISLSQRVTPFAVYY